MDPKRKALKEEARLMYETNPISLAEIADILGINPSTLRRWKFEDSERDDPWDEIFSYRRQRTTRRSARIAREWEKFRIEKQDRITEIERTEAKARKLDKKIQSMKNQTIPQDFNERVNLIFNIQTDIDLAKMNRLQFLNQNDQEGLNKIEKKLKALNEDLDYYKLYYPEEFEIASE